MHDTVSLDVSSKLVMCHVLEEEITSNDIFVKMTEASRTDRLLRQGNGDTTAALKFSRQQTGAVKEITNLAPGIDGNCRFAKELREKVRQMMMPNPQPIFSKLHPAAGPAAAGQFSSAAASGAAFAAQVAVKAPRVAPDSSLPVLAQKAKEATNAAKPGQAFPGLINAIKALPVTGPRPLPGLTFPKPVGLLPGGPSEQQAQASEATQPEEKPKRKQRWS